MVFMNKYFSKSKLKSRGWTEALIRKYLPTPDRTMKNPMFGNSCAPICLYEVSRVESIELSDDFKASLALAASRVKASVKATVTKEKNLLRWVQNLVIDIPEMTRSDIINHAISHFNSRKKIQKEHYDDYCSRHYEEIHEYGYDDEPDFSLASTNSEPSFLARISVNYLRHQCFKYEDLLHQMSGKTGTSQAHDLLKKRINEAIHKKYPWTVTHRVTEV